MKTIRVLFNEVSAKHPELSSFICFGMVIKGMKLDHEIISRHLSRLVEKDDYSGSERKQLIDHLWSLSNTPQNAPI